MTALGILRVTRRLDSRVALVTGGSGSLGRAIAMRLREEGATVIVSDIQAASSADSVPVNGLVPVVQDVTEEAAWMKVIQDIEGRWGHLDILVNNAGIISDGRPANPEEALLSSWREILAVNLDAVFLGCRTAIGAMRRSGGGSIVNVSSVAAFMGTSDATAYGASKAAVRQLTQSVAEHCARMRLNIRCNSVHPGIVWSQPWEQYAATQARDRGVSVEKVIQETKALVPLGDLTTPEDVAAAVAYLASTDSRHVTGCALIVDGGISNCGRWGRPNELE